VTSYPPGALVYLDGLFKGASPVTIVGIPSGVHQLRVFKSGYPQYTSSVTVTTGLKNIQITLNSDSGPSPLPTTPPTTVPTSVPIPPPTPAPTTTSTGSLFVTSYPPGALVYLDGLFKGASPVTIVGIPSGVHQLRVFKSGYPQYTSSVTVTTGLSRIQVSL
jgi:hypothetical protein